MSDNEKRYTERDLILAKRKGWDECAYRLSMAGAGSEESEREKDRAFPLPKTTRPRVVKDPEGDGYWMVFKGEIGWTAFARGHADGILLWEGHDMRRAELFRLTPARVAIWSDLLANPTEEVDDAD